MSWDMGAPLALMLAGSLPIVAILCVELRRAWTRPKPRVFQWGTIANPIDCTWDELRERLLGVRNNNADPIATSLPEGNPYVRHDKRGISVCTADRGWLRYTFKHINA